MAPLWVWCRWMSFRQWGGCACTNWALLTRCALSGHAILLSKGQFSLKSCKIYGCWCILSRLSMHKPYGVFCQKCGLMKGERGDVCGVSRIWAHLIQNLTISTIFHMWVQLCRHYFWWGFRKKANKLSCGLFRCMRSSPLFRTQQGPFHWPGEAKRRGKCPSDALFVREQDMYFFIIRVIHHSTPF